MTISHTAIFWQGGALRGRWRAAQPVASAAEAVAQVDALRAAGLPAMVIDSHDAEARCAAGVAPAWWDFENLRLR